LLSLKTKVRKRRVNRERFIPPYDLSIGQMNAEVLKMQSDLAVALRNGNNVSLRKLIRHMLRSKICRSLAVYRSISSLGARTRGLRDTRRPSLKRIIKL